MYRNLLTIISNHATSLCICIYVNVISYKRHINNAYHPCINGELYSLYGFESLTAALPYGLILVKTANFVTEFKVTNFFTHTCPAINPKSFYI